MSETSIWVIALTSVATALAFVGGNLWLDKIRNKNKPIEALTERISALITSFNAFVGDSMSGKVKEASEYLVSKSPVVLNDKGHALSNDSGITKYIQDNAARYRKLLIEHRGDGIDLLNTCREVAGRELERNDSSITNIKKFFYDKGVSQLLMKEIFAIQLKDLATTPSA